jgi:ADP-heptose:LPS heptosyltransferase
VCLSIKFLHVNKERFSLLAPSFLPVLENALNAQKSLGNLLEDIFLTESFLGRWLYANGGKRFDLLSYTGGTDVSECPSERIAVSSDELQKWDLVAGTYVTFHDGTSSAQRLGKERPTRAWPAERWREFLRLFKKEFPHIKLVQLGGKNSPVYSEADVNLVGKTNVTDLPALMSGARLHLDTESGLVHLAQYLEVKSVVLFGPSSVPFFGYEKNRNIAAGACGGCMWSTTDWMFKCPLGKKSSSCMEDISASVVLQEVKAELSH